MDIIQAVIGFILLMVCYFITKTSRNSNRNKRVSYRNVNIDRDIESMTDREFEFYCAKLLSIMGYSGIKVTKSTGDNGRDIECFKNGEVFFCEVKHFNKKNSTGRPLLMKLVGAGAGDDVNNFIFITSSYFTNQAKEYAKSVNMTLIDRNNIYKILEKNKEVV